MKKIFPFVLATIALWACDKGEPGPTEPPVPDPAGTKTVNFNTWENRPCTSLES